MKRRDFLRLASLGGLLLAAPVLRHLPGAERSPGPRFQRSIYAMGTTVSIVIEGESNSATLEAAANNSFSEIRRLEVLLTRFQPSSQVSELNTNAILESPTDELVRVLTASDHLSQSTSGAFDITVKPALDLFARFLGGGPLPTDSSFEEAQNLIDFEKITLTPLSVGLAKRGMGVTLDGIASGYIVDRAAECLRSFGIRSGMVQAGGTIVTIGSRADDSPWKIGVRDPMDEYGTIGTLELRNQAVATTGDYENFFTPDKSFYHIVNPATARSPLFSHSATVVAPTAFTADPLGVALMVKSPLEGLRMVDGIKGVECLISTRDGSKMASPGLEMAD